MTIAEILKKLESLGSPDNVAGMARYGIVTKRAFGVSAPDLRQLAKEVKTHTKDRHALALELWKTGVHDARAVAYLIDDPKQVTEKQMDLWAKDFDNWAIVDGACGHLFCRSPLAYKKAFEWSERKEEFIKRAGIVLIAWLAVHDKKAADEKIAAFLLFWKNTQTIKEILSKKPLIGRFVRSANATSRSIDLLSKPPRR